MSVKDNNTLKRVDPLYKRYSYGRIRPSLLIHPFEQRRKYGQRKEILGPAINKNPQFNDFSLDYKSTGEPDPFYESDFSNGTDGFASYGGTGSGGNDGISDGSVSYNNVLKFYASDATYHYIVKWTVFTPGQMHRVMGKIYIPPANTNLKQVNITDGRDSDGHLLIDTVGSWVDFELEINCSSSAYVDLRFYGKNESGSTGWTGANSPDDDIFYVKDIKVQHVGLMAYWHFNDVFSRLNGGGGYIGEDWHLGGPVYGDELIIDGGFEEWSSATNLTNWIGAYTSTGVRDILQENSVVYSGDYSVKIKTTNNDGTTDVYIWQNNVPVTPNKLYKISVRTYAKQLTSGYIYLIADGSSGWNFYRTITNTAEPDWTEHTFYYYPKDSTNTIKIGLFNETNGEIYLDNFSIREISNGYHLLLSPGFDYQNQMDGEDPLYKNGRTARLDGVNDYYYIPGSNADWVNPKNNSASYVFWFHTGDSTINKNLFLKYGISPNSSYINIYINEDGKFCFNVKDTDGNGTYLTSLLLEKNTDYCIACVYDKNAAIKKVFVNGVLLNSQSVTFTAGIEPDYDLTIGKDGFVKSSFDSYIYAVAIFNRALSETEIKEINGKAKGYEYHDGSGANAYDGVLKNEGFIQRVENTDHQYQWIGQGSDVVGYLDPSKLYKVMFRLKIDNGKRAFVRLGSAGGTKDWVYTGDGNWHDYYFYTRGEVEGDRIYKYGLYTWDTNTVAEWDNFAIREVRNFDLNGNLIEDFSKGGAVYGDELITDGDCENNYPSFDGTYMRVLAASTRSLSSDYSYSGGQSFKNTGDGSTSDFHANYLVVDNIEVGALYKMECWVYIPASNNDITFLKLWVKDADGSDIRTLAQTETKGEWVKLTGYFIGTDATMHLDYGRHDVLLVTTESFYVDNVSLKKVSNGNHGLAQGGLETNPVESPDIMILDGVNDYEKYHTNLLLTPMSHIVWGWFNPHDVEQGFTIWGEQTDNSDSDGQRLIIYMSGIRAYYGNADGANPLNANDVVENYKWYFVAYIVDEENKTREIWLNDKLVAHGAVPNSYVPPTNHVRWWNRNESSYSGGVNGEVGPHGQVIFNGENGVPDHLPYYYRNFIHYLYKLDKDKFKDE